MQKAAKEKMFFLVLIASALFMCAPSLASSAHTSTAKTRAEIFLLEAENRTEQQPLRSANHVEIHDSPSATALESSVAPRGLVGLQRRVGGEFDVAIGLSKHSEGSATLLNNFARHTNSKTFKDIFGTWGFADYKQLGGRILSALDDSTVIRVNLDRIVRSGDDIGSQLVQVMQRGKTGGLSNKNITNWEIYQILKSESRRSKAVFYLNGKPIDLPSGIPLKVGRGAWRP